MATGPSTRSGAHRDWACCVATMWCRCSTKVRSMTTSPRPTACSTTTIAGSRDGTSRVAPTATSGATTTPLATEPSPDCCATAACCATCPTNVSATTSDSRSTTPSCCCKTSTATLSTNVTPASSTTASTSLRWYPPALTALSPGDLNTTSKRKRLPSGPTKAPIATST